MDQSGLQATREIHRCSKRRLLANRPLRVACMANGTRNAQRGRDPRCAVARRLLLRNDPCLILDQKRCVAREASVRPLVWPSGYYSALAEPLTDDDECLVTSFLLRPLDGVESRCLDHILSCLSSNRWCRATNSAAEMFVAMGPTRKTSKKKARDYSCTLYRFHSSSTASVLTCG